MMITEPTTTEQQPTTESDKTIVEGNSSGTDNERTSAQNNTTLTNADVNSTLTNDEGGRSYFSFFLFIFVGFSRKKLYPLFRISIIWKLTPLDFQSIFHDPLEFPTFLH